MLTEAVRVFPSRAFNTDVDGLDQLSARTIYREPRDVREVVQFTTAELVCLRWYFFCVIVKFYTTQASKSSDADFDQRSKIDSTGTSKSSPEQRLISSGRRAFTCEGIVIQAQVQARRCGIPQRCSSQRRASCNGSRHTKQFRLGHCKAYYFVSLLSLVSIQNVQKKGITSGLTSTPTSRAPMDSKPARRSVTGDSSGQPSHFDTRPSPPMT